MSTVEVMQSSGKMTSQQLRKIKKPIIEKRRRERINESLNQLKTLVLEALEKDESQYNKMEKADILEMTVKHLKHLQNRLSSTTAPMPRQSGGTNIGGVVINKYKAGFKECAEEVNRYLNGVPTVHQGVKEHLHGHLSTCSSTLESCPAQSCEEVPMMTKLNNNNCRSSDVTDSINSITTNNTNTQERSSIPIATGVQIGIPVVNSNGSTSSLLLSSSAMHAQGYLPILISPNGGSTVTPSGISVMSPPPPSQQQHISPQSTAATVPNGVIPLYSSGGHLLYSGAKSPSHESESSVYTSPRSSPPSSPTSSNCSSVDDGYHSSMQVEFLPRSYNNKGGFYTSYSNNNSNTATHNNTCTTTTIPAHSRMTGGLKKIIFDDDSCGQENMYSKYSKEVLIQPSAGHMWRPW